MILSRQLRAHTSTKHRPYSPKSLKCMGNTCCSRLSSPQEIRPASNRTGELRRALGWQSCRRRDGDVRYSVNLLIFIFFPSLFLSPFPLNEPHLGDSNNATIGMTRRVMVYFAITPKPSLPYAVASNRTEWNMRSADDYTR